MDAVSTSNLESIARCLTGMSVNRKTEEVKLSKDRYTFYFGWLMIFFVFIECVLCIYTLASASHSVAWRQALAVLAISIIYMGCIWFTNWLYIRPYRVLQRVSAES